MSESQLVQTIKAHIAKGDKAAEKSQQHYVAAGQHLKTLKAQHSGSWAEWEQLLKAKIGIGKSRASELMLIADGTKTVEKVHEDTAGRTAKTKARLKSSASSGENVEPERPAHSKNVIVQNEGKTVEEVMAEADAKAQRTKALRAQWAADNPEGSSPQNIKPDPNAVEDLKELAEILPPKSYQNTLYDQACLLLEEMTEATWRRFLVHLEEKYHLKVEIPGECTGPYPKTILSALTITRLKNKPKSPPAENTAAPQCDGDNAPPPDVGAEIMMAKLAALDAGIPEIVRRTT
jgi:hypothetical protein